MKIRFIVVFCLLMIVLCIIFYSFFVIKPIVHSYCSSFVKQEIMLAINECSNKILQNTVYEEFFSVMYDQSGDKVLYISTNTININMLIRELIEDIDIKLISISEQYVGIPVGAFSGFAFLADKGEDVMFQCITMSNITSNIKSKYESVGINQTKHTVTIYIQVNFDMVLPYNDYTETVYMPFLLTENVIVGNIPDVYIANEQSTDFMDLVP